MNEEKNNPLEQGLNRTPNSLSSKVYPWGMLFFRTFFFAFFQSLIALFFYIKKVGLPWEESIAWWPFAVIITNVICICIMIRSGQKTQSNYFAQFRINRSSIKQDLLVMIPILLGSVILAMGPNIGLAMLLFHNPQAGLELMNYPLPVWAIILSLIFLPTTQLFAEIPMYLTYIVPNLEKQSVDPWVATIIASLFLSFQHIAMPLIFDPKIMIYKLLMFILFAVYLGIILRWRPRLLPYIVVMHALMDAQLIITNILYAP